MRIETGVDVLAVATIQSSNYYRKDSKMTPTNAIIGRRVLNRRQDCRHGVITAVEPGCNTLVRVLFDGRDFDVALPPSDLAFEDVYPSDGSNVSLAL